METTVLLAVKDALQNAALVADRSVFFTPHENFFPTGVHCPAIGIKDGRSVTTELPGYAKEETLEVKLIAWVTMTVDGEAAVVGDGGIVPLARAIATALHGNRLGMPAVVHHARELGMEPSTFFVTDNKQWLVKKTVTIRYDLLIDSA